MKKIYLVSTLMCSMMFIACGPQNNTVETPEINDTVAESSESSDLEAISTIGDIEVDEGLFNVEMTVPKDLMGEKTQEELDKLRDENGYKSVTLNSDGSVTYVMTKKQHNELMDETRKAIDEGLNEIVTSDDYPNIVAIEPNKDYTKFKVTTKTSELTLTDSFTALAFYMYGGMFNIYNGTPVDNVEIEWIDESTGEVYQTSNSKDMGNEE